MRNRTVVIGGLLATATGIAWGGQFVVGKSALGSVDAFPLSTVRYALAASLWLLLLVGIEGRRSLRLDGRGLRLFWLGSLGFAGVQRARLHRARPCAAGERVADRGARAAPDRARALAAHEDEAVAHDVHDARPRAGGRRARDQRRPPGVDLRRGDRLGRRARASPVCSASSSTASARARSPTSRRCATRRSRRRSAGWRSRPRPRSRSGPAWCRQPSLHQLWDVSPQIAYLALPGAFVAVLAWNGAIRLIGPQNAVLFGNLIPITTFTIEIARGYRPTVVELAGAALTIGARGCEQPARPAAAPGGRHVPQVGSRGRGRPPGGRLSNPLAAAPTRPVDRRGGAADTVCQVDDVRSRPAGST